MTRRQFRILLILGAMLLSLLFTASSPAAVPDVPGYSLTVNPNPAEWQDSFTVTWTKPAGVGSGFIGIYASNREGPFGFLDYTYPSNSGTSGVVSFESPEPGGYWVGWVSADDGQFKAMSFFSVQLHQTIPIIPGYSLTVPNVPYEAGDLVTVTWVKPAGAGYGYIGIWDSEEDGEPGGGPREGVGNYIDFRYATPPGNTGTVTFVAPDEPGNYWAAWVSEDDAQYKSLVSFSVVGEGSGGGDGGGPGDTEAPTVSLTAPADGAVVSGAAVTVSADADDNVGVAGVQFQLDGTNLGAEVTTAPYSISWDTTTFSDGSRTLTAIARDAAGNHTTSAEIAVTINNSTSGGSRVNVAAAANGGAASASSTVNSSFPPSGTIDGDRKGQSWGNGGGWNDGTLSTFPDWLEVDFAGPQTINEIDVFTVQDSYANPVEPALGMPFTLYGITDFQAQYWDGLSWAVIPGGDIAGNNQVWRQLGFAAIRTTKIRIYITGAMNSYSRITEVEAYSGTAAAPGTFAKSAPANGAVGQPVIPTLSWGSSSSASSYEYCIDTTNNNACDTNSWISTANTSAVAAGLNTGTTYFWQVRARNTTGTTEADLGVWASFTTASSSGGHVNVASAANGATATASSFFNSGYTPAGAINGDRKGVGWGSGGGWNDATASSFPDILQVDFAGPQTIDEIDVFTVQDNYASPAEPALGMPFTLYGITTFQVQYWDGSAWVTVTGGNITSNNQVWRQIAFAPVSTPRIRVVVTGALGGYSRITEVEAYSGLNVAPGAPAKSSPANGAGGQPLVPALSWGASSGATSYEYCVDTTNNNTCDGNWVSTSGTSAIVTGRSEGTYFWQVRARNGSGTTEADGGTWSSFTTSSSVVNGAADVASAANGAAASASGFFNAGYVPSGTIDGDRKGQNWGNGGGWNDDSANAYPDWIQINFAGAKTISEVDVFTVQDNYQAPATPTPGMTFTLYGITNFQVQYFDGTNWVNVPGGVISGSNLVWQRIAFPALTTTAIRINVTGALNSYSRITEVEAY
jgi:Bacterial Ig domain/F5/8 type C domain